MTDPAALPNPFLNLQQEIAMLKKAKKRSPAKASRKKVAKKVSRPRSTAKHKASNRRKGW